MGQNFHAGIPAVRLQKVFVSKRPTGILAEAVNEIIDIYQSDTKRLVIPPHPNIPELIYALCQPLTLGPNECFLHVVGSDSDHHVRISVEMAAQ
jgi:hypothetical protein